MAALTDAQVLQSVADLLKQNVASLPPYLGTLVSPGNVIVEAHAAAYNEVLGRLLARGYTAAAVNSWDQLAFYERMISLYFVMVNTAGTFGFDPKWMQQYDRRKDLDTVLVSVGGVFQSPGVSDGPGTVGYGPEDTSSDSFVQDLDDPRRGRPTRF